MASEGVHYFNTLFKKDSRTSIATILKIARFFPSFVIKRIIKA
jgi:hypothetical protein